MAKPKAAKNQDAAIPEAIANGKPAGRGTKRTLAVGPLQIPTLIYIAARGEGISFNMIHDLCRQKVKQQYICSTCTEVEVLKNFSEQVEIDGKKAKVAHQKGEKFVTHSDSLELWCESGAVKIIGSPVTERNQILKGFDIGNETFLSFSKEEVDAQKAIKDDTMEVLKFVLRDQVSSVYFSDSSYLTPDPEVDSHSFALLRAGMVKENRIAVAKLTQSQREKLVFIEPYGKDGMVIHESYMASEIRAIQFPELDAVAAEEAAIASEFIQSMAGDLDMTEYKDQYLENLEAMIEAKRNGEAPKKIEQKAAPKATGTLIEMMKASIQIAKNKKAA